MSVQTNRRTVLKAGAVFASLPIVGFAAQRRAGYLQDPFTLGVASGEPAPDGVVIWTRLAPYPLAEDGRGGMPDRPVDVDWEVATDERFQRVEQRGITTATTDSAHSIHIELTGLRPGRDYFYRFRAEGYISPAGRTRTAPEPGSLAPLTMCFASCSNYEHGWFTAYRHLADEHPDLVLHLGDYQYEYGPFAYTSASGTVRMHVGPEATTLANYRQRYAQYKTDPDLQAAHAVAPWLPVFDDHEVDDNWANEVPSEPQPNFPARRAAALRAYYENMPLRQLSKPRGFNMQLYRRIQWGTLATFHMLDTRQYRDDQPCNDERNSDCAERVDPTRTLMGAEQERWLLNGFQSSQARWDLLGQQVLFSQLDLTPGPDRGFNEDSWDGYPANRDRVISGLVNSPVRNAVVLTGDVHSHFACEVHQDFDDPFSPVVATELVTTSITSGGDGSDSRDDITAVLDGHPHIRYFSNRRGYVRTRITPDEIRADFRVLPYVSAPRADVRTGASFVVPDREAALQSV